MNFTVLRFDSLDSTNSSALEQARRGAEEGVCVVAGRQTAGRGRHGRVWSSPPGAGLYFSVILRPQIEPRHMTLLTLMAGIAVHDTLTDLGLEPDIKWVNDVLVGDKKICGILAETTETRLGLAVVVGIGINLKPSNYPPAIADAATSIAAELGHDVTAAAVEGTLTRFLSYWYEVLEGEGGPDEILKAWRRRSTYFSGKPVTVTVENGTLNGITDGLEPNGALRIKLADGNVRVVGAGDVERLRQGSASI